MCDECGCDQPEKEVDTNISIRAANNAIADTLRSSLSRRGVLVVNIMGAPGSGKTTLIEALAPVLGSIAVIQGDLESDVDMKRLEAVGIPTHQINTHSGCHLNASMVSDALLDVKLEGIEYLIIENVGNLVCPAGVSVGEHVNLVVSSTTEGTDKPTKYPHIFRDAALVILSKADIADAVGFDEASYREQLSKVTGVRIVPTAAKAPDTFEPIAAMLKHRRDHLIGRAHEH